MKFLSIEDDIKDVENNLDNLIEYILLSFNELNRNLAKKEKLN